MSGTGLSGILRLAMIGMIVMLSGCGKPDIDLTEGRFTPCPDSPNCVSSMEHNEAHFIAPIVYDGSLGSAKKTMLTVIDSMKRSRVVKKSENYIHAEFRSLIFRFVDDVELYFPANASVIHIKSASRTGYSDFGTNRRRLEEIRKRFKAQFSD